MTDWSNEETDEPLIADSNFCKVEKWSRDGERALGLVQAAAGKQ